MNRKVGTTELGIALLNLIMFLFVPLFLFVSFLFVVFVLFFFIFKLFLNAGKFGALEQTSKRFNMQVELNYWAIQLEV